MIAQRITREYENKPWPVVSTLTGFVLGILLTAQLMWLFMPKMMIVTKESRLGLNETIDAIQLAVEEEGWGFARHNGYESIPRQARHRFQSQREGHQTMQAGVCRKRSRHGSLCRLF